MVAGPVEATALGNLLVQYLLKRGEEGICSSLFDKNRQGVAQGVMRLLGQARCDPGECLLDDLSRFHGGAIRASRDGGK